MGQNCCAGTRIFVQEGIYDEFLKKATERAEKIVVGDPWSKETEQGPQVRPFNLTNLFWGLWLILFICDFFQKFKIFKKIGVNELILIKPTEFVHLYRLY